MTPRSWGPALAILVVVSGCATQQAPETRPVVAAEASNRPLVGRIRSMRGNMMYVQEEGGESRRLEIYISEGTEITTRDGAMLIPVANLKANMRVTMWLGGMQNDNSGVLTASARRMIVDY
jgi:hypothetical protein